MNLNTNITKKPFSLIPILAITVIGACTQQAKKSVDVTPDPNALSYQLAKTYVQNYKKHAGTIDSLIDIGPQSRIGKCLTAGPSILVSSGYKKWSTR